MKMHKLLLLSDGVKENLEVTEFAKMLQAGLSAHWGDLNENSASWQTSTVDGYDDGLVFVTRIGHDEDEGFFSFTSIATITEITGSINYTPTDISELMDYKIDLETE